MPLDTFTEIVAMSSMNGSSCDHHLTKVGCYNEQLFSVDITFNDSRLIPESYAVNSSNREESFMKNIMSALNIYLTPLIIGVGVLGNLASFLVFVATLLRRQSSSIYLACLAIADIGFLLALLVGWLSWLKLHLFHRYGWCQMVVYVTYVCSFLSVWSVVAFTIERYIVISYPFKRNTLCTARRAKMVVCSLTVFSLLGYSFALWSSGIVIFEETPYCVVLQKHQRFIFYVTYIDTFITLIIPSLIIIVLNTKIAVTIYKFSNRRERMRNPNDRLNDVELLHNRNSFNSRCTNQSTTSADTNSITKHNRSFSQMRTTRLLLTVSTIFIVLNLPSHAFRLQALFLSLMRSATKSSETATRCQELFQFLYYLSFAVNFFLYSLCGAHFRRGLRQLLDKSAHNTRKLWLRLRIVKHGEYQFRPE